MASIKHLFHINAPREKVYNVISTSEGVAKWWSTGATGENKAGAIMTVPFGSFPTLKFKIVELKPNDKIVWECTEGQADWIGNAITFALDENEGKTRVRFEHAGWSETATIMLTVILAGGVIWKVCDNYARKVKVCPIMDKIYF